MTNLNVRYSGVYYDTICLAPIQETPNFIRCFSAIRNEESFYRDSLTNLINPRRVDRTISIHRVSIIFLRTDSTYDTYMWNVQKLIMNYHLIMWIGPYRYIQVPFTLMRDCRNSPNYRLDFDCEIPLVLFADQEFQVNLLGTPFVLHKYDLKGGTNFFFQVALEGIVEKD